MGFTTGVVICSCGPNIGEAIDLTTLSAEIARRRDVGWVRQYSLPCSKDERKAVIELLKEQPVNGLVVAGCSPKEREKTFQEMLTEAGLNPYMLQFANIREHCAWVESDKEAAGKKAAKLIAAAIARVRRHEPIEERSMKVHPEVLVIGAGVAGMVSSILMAREGRTVHLIDRAASIGGRVPLLGELFPNMECSSCAIEPMMDEVLHDKNIRMHLRSELTAARGFFGNFKVTITTGARGVDPDACMGCGLCLEPCPVSVPDAYNFGMNQRKAIHNPYQGALPNAPAVDWDACLRSKGQECAVCAGACPFGAIDLSARGTTEELEVGAIVIATGAGVDASQADGAGVVTAEQFERLINPGGHTAGEIKLPLGDAPRSISIIAFDDQSIASRLISMNAVKYVVAALDKLPQAAIDLYIGNRCLVGERELERWAEIERFKNVTIHRLASTRDLAVDRPTKTVVVSGASGGSRKRADLIVLCLPSVPSDDTAKLAGLLGLELNERGFYAVEHQLLEPVSTNIRGVYVAGSAAGPRPVSDTVTQGDAVSGKVLSALRPETELELNPFTSSVNADLCSGCETCLSICPYSAIGKDESGAIAVEQVLCHGCGVCSAACPSGAMQTKHFKLDQIMAELDALCCEGE
jgi:heterodisulfide reductase subunit A2